MDGSHGPEGIVSDAFLDDLLHHSRDAIVLLDDAAVIRYASPPAPHMFGYDLADIVGKRITEFAHPDDDAEARLTRRSDIDGLDLGRDVRIKHSTGHWLTATARLKPVGQGLVAVTITLDETTLSRESTLRGQLVVEEYCNKLTADLTRASGSVEVFDRLTYSLEEVGRLTGAHSAVFYREREHEQILERAARWLDPRHADETVLDSIDQAVSPELFEAVMNETFVVHDIAEIRNEGLLQIVGRSRASSFISAPVVFGRQRGVLALGRWGPPQRWRFADAQLVRSTASVYAQVLHRLEVDQLWTLTYQKGPVGFSIRTRAGDLVECNQRYLDLYGLTTQEAAPRNIQALLHPDDLDVLNATIEDLIRDDYRPHQVELRTILPDGSTRWLRVTIVGIDVPGRTERLHLSTIIDVTENYEQRQHLEYAASHDSLTGAANRTALMERIGAYEKAWDRLPDLLMIDLDRFKLINDSLGHIAGDLALQAVIERVSGEIGDVEGIARLGGDEFAVIVPESWDGRVEELAEQLRLAMHEPLQIADFTTRQTISIGVARGTESTDASELLICADRAMYAAKALGRNRYVVFDDSMRDEALLRVELERELRDAIDRGELEVHFQPEFMLDTLEVVGAEALLRWIHPVRGTMTANRFIRIAEETGMIEQLGGFAIRDACLRMAEFAASSEAGRNLVLRINVSAREFAQPDLPAIVRDALEQSGLPPTRLCLEITETTLMEAPGVLAETFEELGSMGVEFAIDDFGTGYSSLAYIKRFPVDALKIDRSFVDDITDDDDSRAIVESILGLGASLGLHVIAEGIENEEQLDLLRALGCKQGQGHLVGPALPFDEFTSLVLASVR